MHARARVGLLERPQQPVGDAGANAGLDVHLLLARRDDDQRRIDVVEAVHGTNGAAQVERVHAREPALQDHERRTFVLHHAQQLAVIARDPQRAAVGAHRGGEHACRLGIDGDQDASLRGRRHLERLPGRRGLRHGARRRGCLELDHEALGRTEHLEPRAGRAPAREGDQLVDTGVAAHRIVVVEREPAHPAGGGEVDRELDRAVAPAEVLLVLAEGELRVVDQEIRASDEGGVVDLVGAARRPLAAREGRRMRLVIGGVDDRRAVGLDPVAERQRRMVHVVRGDAHVVDLDAAFDQVVVADLGGELLDRDREVRVLHLARERLADRRPEAARAVDVPLEVSCRTTAPGTAVPGCGPSGCG